MSPTQGDTSQGPGHDGVRGNPFGSANILSWQDSLCTLPNSSTIATIMPTVLIHLSERTQLRLVHPAYLRMSCSQQTVSTPTDKKGRDEGTTWDHESLHRYTAPPSYFPSERHTHSARTQGHLFPGAPNIPRMLGEFQGCRPLSGLSVLILGEWVSRYRLVGPLALLYLRDLLSCGVPFFQSPRASLLSSVQPALAGCQS